MEMPGRKHVFQSLISAASLSAVLFLAACATPREVPRLDQARAWQALGSVKLDAENRWLIVSGFVNQVEGAIELLACGPGGKTHESVFVLYAKPVDIQTGLLLLGFKHGPPMPGLGMGPPLGDPVQLHVFWNVDGIEQVSPAESFIRDYKTGKTVRHGAWIYNGSKVENGYFLANAEDSLIASYWDPWAIINLQADVGADDERLMGDRQAVPPLHTPIILLISPDVSK